MHILTLPMFQTNFVDFAIVFKLWILIWEGQPAVGAHELLYDGGDELLKK